MPTSFRSRTLPSHSVARARGSGASRSRPLALAMSSKFMNNALGLTGPAGLASWCVAGAGAYYFFYLPEEKKRQDEIERAANAARLMRGKEYTEFVAKHEAKSAAKKGWFGGWFGGSKK